MDTDGKVKVYSVCKDGKEVFQGTIREVEEKTGVKENYIYYGIKNSKPVKGYVIKHIGYADRVYGGWHVDRVKKRVRTDPEEVDMSKDHFEYLRYHLKTYGSTACYQFDPVPYLPQLYDIGLDCRVKEVEEKPVNSLVTKRGRRKKPKIHWFVEVAHAERGSQGI